MELKETKLQVPKEFLFPFAPYRIQEELMRKLYSALEEKKLGIFESPTGTGKSMSIICGSVKWLMDAEERLKRDVFLKIEDMNRELKEITSEENWLEEQSVQAKTKKARDALQHFLNSILSFENRITEIQLRAKRLLVKLTKSDQAELAKLKKISDHKNKYLKTNCSHHDDIDENFEDFELLLNEYESLFDDHYAENEESVYFSSQVDENYENIKILLCSRTHSQLAQIIKEIQKSPYNGLGIRAICLASRQNYCINQSVLNLKHLPLINEKCQELLSAKKEKITKNSKQNKPLKKQKINKGCSFYNKSNIEDLKAKALTEIHDVENLVKFGKKLNSCPYYAARSAIEEAQIIVVPYNTILHKTTRLACGINIKNSVVIIDEAHNLLDAITNLHNSSVTKFELSLSQKQLIQYKDKFGEKLTPHNLLFLNQLLFLIGRLIKKLTICCGDFSQQKCKVTIETLSEFITSCEIDTINLYKLLEFVSKSRIVFKLRGFLTKQGSLAKTQSAEQKGISAFLKTLTNKKEPVSIQGFAETVEKKNAEIGNPLLSVVNFIRSLTNHCLEGRVLSATGPSPEESALKFLLLNPASQFGDVVEEARSVVLVGGTMQPFSEFTDQLFRLAGGSVDRITTFTCGHVIPKDNILPVVVTRGPTGHIFDFSYKNRNNEETLNELGRLLVNVCNVTPKGIVCFFPSYEYKNYVFRYLEKEKIIDRIEKKKEVLQEPKNSSEVDQVLKKYAAAVKIRGALLLSVVGGKLSEGLNFNDDLGRCVILVGLPYSNLNNPELKEKMDYLNETMGPGAGKTYYENLCMKAVNQSIGRSVRHKDDYASVLLIDQRYSRVECTKALPEWIRGSLRQEKTFGSVVGTLAKFFAAKKNQYN